jgi:hypothetical protein
MEIYAISSLATAVSSTPGKALTGWLYSKFMKWRLKKKLYGIVVLKGCSTICQKLSSSNVLFFDIDVLWKELVAPKEAEEVHLEPTIIQNYTAFPILRTHLYNLSSVYKNKIVVVSKSLELLRAMGIYDNNVKFFCFSKSMEANIGVIFPNEKEHSEAVVTKFRTIQQLESNQVVIVENLADLETKVKHNFNITEISI